MPINTNLNQSPYFDDFDIENQYYRVLFKPGFAVQARELTQLQSMLQNQVEQFGDNIFKEGSIVKGCSFTNLDDLRFVKLIDVVGFDPTSYISRRVIENSVQTGGQDLELDYIYEVTGANSGLKAQIISAARGFETRPPDLNTFFINYLAPTDPATTDTEFRAGEPLTVVLKKYKVGVTNTVFAEETQSIPGLAVTSLSNHVGKSFGIQSSPGVVFQKGHFLFAADQVLVISKYNNLPDGVSVGYSVQEKQVNALQDNDLYDNANGSSNENAPGADRLQLIPTLTVLPTTDANTDSAFFTLIRYQNGNAITLRDVSQYNVLGEELARRTFEESGNYVLKQFPVATDDRDGDVNVLLGTGTAYVKGFRVENSGERSFVVDQIAQTEVQNNNSVSFDYGNYVDVTAFTGTLDIDWTPVNLQDSGGSNIGTAIAINASPTRVYLTAVTFTGSNKAADLARISDGSGFLEVGNRLHETARKSLLFDTGMKSLFATSDTLLPIREKIAATHTANVITLTANPGEDFDVHQDDILVVDGSNTQIPVTGTLKTLNNSQLDIYLDASANSATNVTLYYNKRLVGAGSNGVEPYNKTVAEPYIKVNFTSATTQYSLGFPDVFDITEVKDASGNDFTSSFKLVNNQKDTYYDISYMEYIQGRPVPANGVLTIKLKVFQLSTSSGEYFFTINSYPNSLDAYDIPVYVSQSGNRFNLRECFDFRPYLNKDASADYSAVTEGAAPTITTAVGAHSLDWSTYGPALIPARSASATTDIEYYLSRIDVIVADSYGEISLIKGKEEKLPAPPRVEAEKLVIAEVTVPGFPALSSAGANTAKKREYAVKARSTGIKNYTMKDLHSLEKKIDNMAYYISLNQLESETQNLSVLDENGLNRFKNGFIVDPFNDLSLADIQNPNFMAAVPFNQKILTPAVKTYALDLTYKTSSNASIFPSTSEAKAGTLSRNQNVDIISQPYASGFRNAVSNFYKYQGDGIISPPYDAAYDTTTNPVTIDIDMSTAFEEFVDNIQEFLPLTDTTQTVELQEDRWGWGRRFGGRGRGATEVTTITTRTSEISVNQGSTQEQFVGDFVSNFSMKPYMAGRDIKVYMSGLRPNIQHYFFFDGVDVNAHVIPGSPDDSAGNIKRNGNKGDAVTTDANGVLRAVFSLPPETFFVGDRVLEIADVNLYNSIESGSTSRGFVTYRAYNFAVEKTALTTSTRQPDFDINTTTTTRNVARRPRGRDPIAQTFFIKKGMGQGSNSVYLSEVDVFFKRVSTTNGVSLQVREVVNGYPSNQIVPFSVVHKIPTELTSASSDDASVATTFAFEAPVRLDVEKEYAIVIQPDASDPNYLVYTSKVGGTDLTPGDTQGAAIVQDWGDGVLFSSTNNSAWKSYQDEDMKFTLRRHDFNQTTGSVTLTNNDHEFLTVNNFNGRFNLGETIYQAKSLQGSTSATVNVPLNSATMTGTNLDDTYADNDFILISNAGNTESDIFKVVSVLNSTTITLDKPASFAVSNGTGTPVVVGRLSYYNKNNPYEMHLEESSVRSSNIFSPGLPIVGLDSGKTADIVSIDNINFSYVQPLINRAVDSTSKTLLGGTFVPPTNVNTTYTLPMEFNNNNHFSKEGVIVYSKSNDPNRSKAFDLTVDFDNGNNTTSTPFLDIETSKLLAYTYKITNSSATTSKYISKIIELAPDADAEDLHLIVTGYRPTGSDIKCYIKPQNSYDSDVFDLNPWIELELFEGNGVFSSNSNLNDYREFKFRVSDANKATGVLTYANALGTNFDGFRRFAIKIEMLSPNVYNAPTLRDYRGIALT